MPSDSSGAGPFRGFTPICPDNVDSVQSWVGGYPGRRMDMKWTVVLCVLNEIVDRRRLIAKNENPSLRTKQGTKMRSQYLKTSSQG